MHYPQLKTGRTKTLAVEALSGGCNRRDGSRRTAASQLLSAENLWWQEGALRTRPAFFAELGREEFFYKSDIRWKFCNQDVAGGVIKGRRFLRRIYYREGDSVRIEVGILTHDGQIVVEGGVDGVDTDVDGTLMEYPYTASENVLIFLTDGRIFAQNSQTRVWRQVDEEVYVPCIQVGMTGVKNLWDAPPNEGILYEGRNLLTDRFSVKYTTDGTSSTFYLPLKELDEEQPVEINILYYNGGVTNYIIPAGSTTCELGSNDLRPVFDRQKGVFYFLNGEGAVMAPMAGFANNMTVTASKARSERERQIIPTMQFSTWFGGSQVGTDSRLFISGSPLVPNRIYWSGQGQPLYFPDTNYLAVGDLNCRVTAFGKQDGKLVIFKEQELYCISDAVTDVGRSNKAQQQMQTASAQTAYFPLTQLHGQIGCPSPASVCLCENQLVWSDGQGVYTLSSATASSPSHVRELSSLIASELRAHTPSEQKAVSAAVWRGYYLLLIGRNIYGLRIDERVLRQYNAAYDGVYTRAQPAWYIWQLPASVSYLRICGEGQLMLLSEEKIEDNTVETVLTPRTDGADTLFSQFQRESYPIESMLRTKDYDFGDVCRRKRVLRVRVGIQSEGKATARFLYAADGKMATDTVTLRESPPNGMFFLSPNCTRVRWFGFAMRAVGLVAVDSLIFSYRC